MNPTKDIYQFVGILKNESESKSNELDLKQFIPRGCILKNSTKTYAMVIYTGTDTKLALNQGKYISKISNISWQLNIYFAINIAVMLVMAAMMAFVGNVTWNKNTGVKHYYIFDEAEGPIDYAKYSGTAFMSFYLLFANILPLDMAITLMLSKLLLVQIVQADWHMVDYERSCQEGDLIGCAVKNLTMLEDFA
jgi:phospholipid-translocating ATPase